MKRIIITLVFTTTLIGLAIFVLLGKDNSSTVDSIPTTQGVNDSDYNYSDPGVVTIYPNQGDTQINTTSQAPVGSMKLLDGSIITIPEVVSKNEKTTTLSDYEFRVIAGGETGSYTVSYLPYDKQSSQVEFNVRLNKLPLAKSRLEAEDALRNVLKINNKELCNTDISVWVLGPVSETYSGRNLGLSFCSNAEVLP